MLLTHALLLDTQKAPCMSCIACGAFSRGDAGSNFLHVVGAGPFPALGTAQDQLAAIQERYKQASGSVNEMTRKLALLSDELDNIKAQMDERVRFSLVGYCSDEPLTSLLSPRRMCRCFLNVCVRPVTTQSSVGGITLATQPFSRRGTG